MRKRRLEKLKIKLDKAMAEGEDVSLVDGQIIFRSRKPPAESRKKKASNAARDGSGRFSKRFDKP